MFSVDMAMAFVAVDGNKVARSASALATVDARVDDSFEDEPPVTFGGAALVPRVD